MAFDPDKYLAKKAPAQSQGFDPDAYLAKASTLPTKPRKAEAFLEGLGEAGTLGYLQKLQAAAEPAITGALNIVTGEDVESAPYDERVKYFEGRERQLKEQEPTAFLTGELAGTAAQLAVPGMAAGKIKGAASLLKPAASVSGRIAQSAATSGILSAADESAGDTIAERAKTGLKGAVIGAAGGAIGEGIGAASKALRGTEKGLKEGSDALVLKQLGASKKDFKELFGKNKAAEVADFANEQGIMKGAPSVEKALERTKKVKERAGKEIGEIYKKVGTAVKANPDELGVRLLDRLGSSTKRPLLGKDAAAFDKAANDVIEDILAKGDKLSDPKYVNDIIGSLDEKIRYSKQVQDLPANQTALFEIRDEMRKYLTKLTDDVGKALDDPGLAERYKKANKTYGTASRIETMAADKKASNAVNRLFSLTDYQSGLGGAAIGAGQAIASGDPDALTRGLLYGAAGAVGNRAARKLGPGLLSKGGKAAGKAGRALKMAQPRPITTGLLSSKLAEGEE